MDQTENTCQNCGAPLTVGAQICDRCGMPVAGVAPGSNSAATLRLEEAGEQAAAETPAAESPFATLRIDDPPAPEAAFSPEPASSPAATVRMEEPAPFGAGSFSLPASEPAFSSVAAPQPPKKKNTGLIIGVVVVLALCLCICACSVTAYFVIQSMGRFN